MMPVVKELDIRESAAFRSAMRNGITPKTGVTVLYFPRGARAGCHISGGGAGFPGNASYFAGNSGQSGRCHRFIRRLSLRPGGRRWRHEMPRKTRYRLRHPCLPCSSGVSVLYFRSGLRQRDPPPGRVPWDTKPVSGRCRVRTAVWEISAEASEPLWESCMV